MPDAIWIDRDAELPALARALEAHAWIGVDTEFLRERTFFPKLCLLQLAACQPACARRVPRGARLRHPEGRAGCPNNAGHPAIAPDRRCRYIFGLHQKKETT